MTSAPDRSGAKAADRLAARRRRARELALQVLYAVDVSREASEPAMEAVLMHEHARGEEADYARWLIRGTLSALPELDPLLARWSESWPLPRMAAVDRNLLRLAAYELLHGQVPLKVVLNEAIEIAKRFGDHKSPAFVNAILDKIGREAKEVPSPPPAPVPGSEPSPSGSEPVLSDASPQRSVEEPGTRASEQEQPAPDASRSSECETRTRAGGETRNSELSQGEGR